MLEQVPMITKYNALYEVLDKMSNQLSCGACGVCENDLVYLLPEEVLFFQSLGIELIEVEGVHYIVKSPKHNGFCPFRDQEKRCCLIYDVRPAICRMFPLEIKATSEGCSWAVCTYCPKVASNEDSFVDLLTSYIPQIESCLDASLIGFLSHADRITSRMEQVLSLTTKSMLL